MFRFDCPKCSRNNSIHENNVGHTVRCIHCKQRIDWEEETPVCAKEDSPPQKRKLKWKELAAGIITLCICLPILFISCWELYEAYQSRSWPSVKGIIHLSTTEVAESTPGTRGGQTSKAKIHYSYEIDGKKYKNDVVRFGQVYSNSRLFGKAKKTSQRHPTGPATIYYDPTSPNHSVLEPGFSFDVFLMPGVFLIFVIIGAFAIRPS